MTNDKDNSKSSLQRRSLPSGNPHDAYFKTVMGEARNARDLIHRHLPEDMTRLFASDLPERIQGSFVDESLSEHLSDMLYRIRLKSGHDTLVYTLIEHKSSPDALAPLQLLCYMVCIWEELRKDSRKENRAESRGRKLPVIIPLVFYHGKSRWTVPTCFARLFEDVPEALQGCIPDFLYEVVDLGQIEDAELAGDPRLAALLMPMKYIYTPEIMQALMRTAEKLLALDKMDFQLLLSYIIQARRDIGRRDVNRILDLLPLPEQEDIMTGLAQEFKDDWYKKGKTEGRAEGKAEGKAELLLRLLERRFGPLAQEEKKRVLHADADTLEHWGDRMFEVLDLAAVFVDDELE